MSLGLLGDYGTDSEISDTDEEFPQSPPTEPSYRSSNKSTPKSESNSQTNKGSDDHSPTGGDPLNVIQSIESDNESASENSDSSSPNSPSCTDSSEPKVPSAPLPLPDLDIVMASSSSLTSDSKEQQSTNTSSVFYNPYKEAEEARLAVLKKHVVDFDKKPAVKERKKDRNVTEVYSYDPVRQIRHSTSRQYENVHPQSRGPLLSTPGSSSTPHYTGIQGSGFESSQIASAEGSCEDHADRTVSRSKRKRRSGVGESLMPAKKFLQTYKAIQSQERPWTVAPK